MCMKIAQYLAQCVLLNKGIYSKVYFKVDKIQQFITWTTDINEGMISENLRP